MTKIDFSKSRVTRALGASAAAAAAVTGAGMVGNTPEAQAEIVWSGIVNLNVPNTIDGLYVNVVTGATGSSGADTAGWDVNPYSSTTLTWFAPTGGGNVRTGGSSLTLVDNLAPGFLIDADANPGGTWGGGTVETIGATAWVFNSSDNITGFRFLNEATGLTHYGWMRMNLGATLTDPRSIVEWAYEDQAGVGINAGQISSVPEPGTLGLLAMGAAGLVASRRRRTA
jgi:hypothetical protein